MTCSNDPIDTTVLSTRSAKALPAGGFVTETGGSLAFSFENASQQPVIYITDDPARNVLSFTILNNTHEPLALWKGTPIPESQQKKDGPSCLYLSLQGLVSEAEFKAVTISAPGWQSTWFPAEKQWGLTPSTDINLPAQGSITFTINKLLANERPSSGFLNVDYWNIGLIPPSNDQIKVFLQNPPSSQRQDLNLNHGLLGSNLVLVSDNPEHPVDNSLKIFLANQNPTHPVVPSTTPWEENPPVFILSFVYGENPGYGALSTAKQASNIAVAASGGSDNRWQVVPNLQGPNPYWQLLPQDHNILGTGQNATMNVTLDNIITYLQPGLTLLYLQFANIPGYNDGYYSLLIQKDDPVKINSFYLETPWRSKTSAPAPVTLNWEVSNAVSLELRSEFGAQDVTGMSSWTSPKPATNSSKFTLHASGQNNLFDDANVAFKIVDFKVTPNLASELKPQTYQSGAYSQMWDRAYFIQPNGYFLTFDTKTNKVLHNTKLPAGYLNTIAASPSIFPDKDRIYLTDSVNHTLLVVDIDSQGKPTITKTIKTPQYSGYAVGVSPDGQTVYFQSGGPPPNFDGIGFFNVKDYALQYFGFWAGTSSDIRDLVVSPDGSTLYATSGGNLLLAIETSNHTLIHQTELGTPHNGSWKMALTPDGKQIYISNYGRSITTVVFPDENWRTEVIQSGTNTFNVVATSAVGIVFALIPATDSLAVIDTATRKVTQIIPIISQVPKNAALVGSAMSPDGRKLYLSDNGGSFVIALLEIDIIGQPSN